MPPTGPQVTVSVSLSPCWWECRIRIAGYGGANYSLTYQNRHQAPARLLTDFLLPRPMDSIKGTRSAERRLRLLRLNNSPSSYRNTRLRSLFCTRARFGWQKLSVTDSLCWLHCQDLQRHHWLGNEVVEEIYSCPVPCTQQASNHPTISSPPNKFATQSHCPVQKWLQPSSEGHLGEKIDGFIFFPLCRSSAAGDGGAATGGGGAATHGRGGAPGGSTRAISHNRRGMLNQSTKASTRGRP